jgi:integrase
MAALRAHASLSARALEFTILTGARANESAPAQWREIDLRTAICDIPAPRMKRERPHRVPLVGRALEIPESYREKSGWVFPGIGKRAGKAMSEAALSKMPHLMGDWRDKAGDRITAHGFRSSFRDWAGERTSFPREVAEKDRRIARATTMTRRRKAKSPEYTVSDEAAAYIADALMELALQFEATHFAQIRRHCQSITLSHVSLIGTIGDC